MFATKNDYTALHEERSAAATFKNLLINYRPLLIVISTGFAGFYLLPLSLHILVDIHAPGSFEDDVWGVYRYVYPASFVMFLVFTFYAGRRLLDDNRKRAKWRSDQRQYETIVDGT